MWGDGAGSQLGGCHGARATPWLSLRSQASWCKPVPPARTEEILGARGLGATLFSSPSFPMDDRILFLHPVPILQSELAPGPLAALHPVTPRTSPPCRGPARSLERAGRDRTGHRHQQPPRELGLRAGGLPWCKFGQDAAGSPLGNGCHFLSIAVPHLPAPSILTHTAVAPGPRGNPAVHDHIWRAEEGKKYPPKCRASQLGGSESTSKGRVQA